jgi:ParB family chromosome partitioning protein
MQKQALGKGLGALIPDLSTLDDRERKALGINEIELDKIIPNEYQPRKYFDDEKLKELAASIREQGVIQPIIVHRAGSGYELIAGERRWRASRLAGLKTIPALVKEATKRELLEMALIENIQREDLNPLEEAQGVQRLIREFDFTHEQAAAAIGRSRSATSNLLRLLNLAAPVQQMLMEGAIDMGHARALLAVDAAHQIQFAHRISAKGLSVREAEALVANAGRSPKADGKKRERSRDIVRLEEELADILGAVVKLSAGAGGRGKLVIEFSSLEQLDGIVERLRRA